MSTVSNVLRRWQSILPPLQIWMTPWHSLRLQLPILSVLRIKSCITEIRGRSSAATLFFVTYQMDSRRDTPRLRTSVTTLLLPGKNPSLDMSNALDILARRWGISAKAVQAFLVQNASLTTLAQAITSLHFWWPPKRNARISNKSTGNLRFI